MLFQRDLDDNPVPRPLGLFALIHNNLQPLTGQSRSRPLELRFDGHAKLALRVIDQTVGLLSELILTLPVFCPVSHCRRSDCQAIVLG